MADTRDFAALMRHAADAGDRPLLLLLARCIAPGALRSAPTTRAYATLAVRLGLIGRPATD
jgi:hypothetical protein